MDQGTEREYNSSPPSCEGYYWIIKPGSTKEEPGEWVELPWGNRWNHFGRGLLMAEGVRWREMSKA
jgi:hypothetical protein